MMCELRAFTDLTLPSNDAAAYYSEAHQQGRRARSQALLFCMSTECLGDSRGEKVYGNFSGTFAAPGKDPRIP